jgi:hypothetical protein
MGQTGPEEIKLIKKTWIKNSPDLDGISLSQLKSTATEICQPLSHIINLSLLSGTFPDKLKTSKVVPIFKAVDKLRSDNYSPISLVSSITKILEKAVANRLVGHLVGNNLLNATVTYITHVTELGRFFKTPLY